jgi:uncharacterized membrane protein YdjX (TVP38/TMEM64 family)
MKRQLGKVLNPRVLGLIALAIAAIVLIRLLHLGAVFAALLDHVRDLGALAPLLFMLLYIVGTVGFVPGSILTLGGGAIFGLVWGSLYVSIAATIGATLAFLIGRYAAREWVRGKLAENPRFNAVDKAVSRRGWRIVALVRLSPLFPFNLINYAFGLTGVPLLDYFLATWVGILPGTILYVYIGSLGGKLAQPGTHRTPLEWAIDAIGLLATIGVVVYVGRIAAKAVQEEA